MKVVFPLRDNKVFKVMMMFLIVWGISCLVQGQFDFTSDITAPISLGDHAARHENEGADEISLTGLSGDPADTLNESLLTTQNDIIVRGASIAERLNITAQTLVGRLTGGNISAVR